jgi:hypothetical protein
MKTTELKQKIQELIDKAVKRQKQRLNYLFRQLDEVRELETIDRCGSDKLLEAINADIDRT